MSRSNKLTRNLSQFSSISFAPLNDSNGFKTKVFTSVLINQLKYKIDTVCLKKTCTDYQGSKRKMARVSDTLIQCHT